MSSEARAGRLQASTFAWPRRPMTADERERLVRQGNLGPRKVVWALAPLIVGAVIGVVVAQLSHWGIELFASPDDAHLAATFGIVALAAIGAVVSFVMLMVYWQTSRPYREDARAATVEVIDGVVSRVLDLGTPVSPAYLAEVGHGQLVFVCGSWLRDPASFADGDVAFPRAELTLARAPRSGAVLGVEARGEPVTPERWELPGDGAGPLLITSRDSEVIEGSIDQVLAAAGAVPRAKP